MTERFLAAAVNGDVESLLAAMAPGVVLIADGGGKVTAARRPIVGADKVARFLAAVAPQGVHLPGLRVEVAEINGAPAVVAWTDDGPVHGAAARPGRRAGRSGAVRGQSRQAGRTRSALTS